MVSISYIVPVYNTNKGLLEKCINSIKLISDKYNINYELLIINDGSTKEETVKYLKSIKMKYVKIYNLSNHGVSYARNYGLKKSKLDYIYFVDSDDEIIDLDIDNLKAGYDILFLNYKIGSNNSNNKCFEKKSSMISNILFDPNDYDRYYFGSIWGKMFKRLFLITNKISFNTSLKYAEDRLFMLNGLLKTNNIFISDVLSYLYRINPESVTHKIDLRASEIYRVFFNDAMILIKENKVKYDDYKYLLYGIINEVISYNFNGKVSIKEAKQRYYDIMKEFDGKKYFKRIKFSDFCKIKTKIRILCYKYNCWWIIYLLYRK